MLKLDDANPIVIKAKKKLEEVEQAEFRAEVRGALKHWDKRFSKLPQ